MTEDLKKEKMNKLMNKISLELKDEILQTGFEIICKRIEELENLKKIILKIIINEEIGYTVKDKTNDITMLCRFGIDDTFRKIRPFLFEE